MGRNRNPNIKYCPRCGTEYFSPGRAKSPCCGVPLVPSHDLVLLSEASLEISVEKKLEQERRIPVEVKNK